MSLGRRHFIRSVGASLGSLIVSGAISGCRDKSKEESSTTTSSQSRAQWQALRQCWLDLDTLREGNMMLSPIGVPPEFNAKHRAALDALIAANELAEPVAEQMQVAFEEAGFHIVRSRATCYMSFPFEMDVREDLVKRTKVLSETSALIDPMTLAQARTAIIQDMAFFETMRNHRIKQQWTAGISTPETQEVARKEITTIRENYRAGKLEASQEAIMAAMSLTELLMGKSG